MDVYSLRSFLVVIKFVLSEDVAYRRHGGGRGNEMMLHQRQKLEKRDSLFLDLNILRIFCRDEGFLKIIIFWTTNP